MRSIHRTWNRIRRELRRENGGNGRIGISLLARLLCLALVVGATCGGGLPFPVGTAPQSSMVPVAAQEPELTPQAYLPLVLSAWPPKPGDLDTCEPNGAPASACRIEAGIYLGHVSSPYDQDWYTFTLDGDPGGVERDVCVSLKVPEGDDYDLYLYGDPPEWPIAFSTHPGNARETVEAALPAGSYYILVFPTHQASSLPYTLALEVDG
jgi:hypothetical protein